MFRGVCQGVMYVLSAMLDIYGSLSLGHDDVTLLAPDWLVGSHHGPVVDCP